MHFRGERELKGPRVLSYAIRASQAKLKNIEPGASVLNDYGLGSNRNCGSKNETLLLYFPHQAITSDSSSPPAFTSHTQTVIEG